MTKITEFDKQNIPALRADIDAVLVAVGERYGITLHAAGAKYTGPTCTFNLECSVREASGEAMSKYRAEFQVASYRDMFGLEEGDTELTVTYNRELWKLEGLAMKRRKYPIVMKRVPDGKITLFTEDVISKIVAARSKVSTSA